MFAYHRADPRTIFRREAEEVAVDGGAERASGVVDFTRRLFEALSVGDEAWLTAHLDERFFLIGLSDSLWLTREAFLPVLAQHVADGAWRWEPGDLLVDTYDGMAIVWCRVALPFDDGSELSPRCTLVLREGDDDWSVVHVHVSLPSD